MGAKIAELYDLKFAVFNKITLNSDLSKVTVFDGIRRVSLTEFKKEKI